MPRSIAPSRVGPVLRAAGGSVGGVRWPGPGYVPDPVVDDGRLC